MKCEEIKTSGLEARDKNQARNFEKFGNLNADEIQLKRKVKFWHTGYFSQLTCGLAGRKAKHGIQENPGQDESNES
jgi:hypothetical protein